MSSASSDAQEVRSSRRHLRFMSACAPSPLSSDAGISPCARSLCPRRVCVIFNSFSTAASLAAAPSAAEALSEMSSTFGVSLNKARWRANASCSAAISRSFSATAVSAAAFSLTAKESSSIAWSWGSSFRMIFCRWYSTCTSRSCCFGILPRLFKDAWAGFVST